MCFNRICRISIQTRKKMIQKWQNLSCSLFLNCFQSIVLKKFASNNIFGIKIGCSLQMLSYLKLVWSLWYFLCDPAFAKKFFGWFDKENSTICLTNELNNEFRLIFMNKSNAKNKVFFSFSSLYFKILVKPLSFSATTKKSIKHTKIRNWLCSCPSLLFLWS